MSARGQYDKIDGAIESARVALIAELLPHLPDGLMTPIGMIEVQHFRVAMQRAIEAYENVVEDNRRMLEKRTITQQATLLQTLRADARREVYADPDGCYFVSRHGSEVTEDVVRDLLARKLLKPRWPDDPGVECWVLA